jgi:hypothetical protein
MPGNLTNDQRKSIVWFLVDKRKNENLNGLQRGALQEAAEQFNCSVETVKRIWYRAKDSLDDGDLFPNVDSRIKGNSGRKVIDRSAELEVMSTVPMRRRQTIRSLAAAIHMPTTSTFRLLTDQKKIKRISSTVKPLLTPENELSRVKFVLTELSAETGQFFRLPQKVHIDEKWFFLTKVKNTYYLLLDEEPPERSCQSKRFITKVMFMAAVAQPRFDENGVCTFDGKLGIWPFVKKELAIRSSRNRPAGTLVTKNMDSVGRAEVSDMMINKVLPAIREQWPDESKEVIIQQDNAKPHLKLDKNLIPELTKDGWRMGLQFQPANSPDFNMLDLGFFNAIQSLQHQKVVNTIDELIQAVEEAFWEHSVETLQNTWLTYQKVMESSLIIHGSNKYQLPHMHKRKLRNEGTLPDAITVPDEVIFHAIERLSEN